MSNTARIDQVKAGFSTVQVADTYKTQALHHLETWLTNKELEAYVPLINYCIEQAHWDYILDCFFQEIPFGTGGRRGEVGLGPNRINPYTIQASAQGHAQFLLKEYGDEAKTRGVVIAYDVRQFLGNKHLDLSIPSPLNGVDSASLASAAAQVYAANQIKVYLFDAPRSTPELSFAIRHLNAVGGDMISASHNPPDHNGKKVYDHFGGQLVPPEDEALVIEVTTKVKAINSLDFQEALNANLITIINQEVDEAYIAAVKALSLSQSRSAKISFTPLHGCASTSVLPVMQQLGFDITPDPETSNQSGAFEHVTFNIPNPEVIQSFDTTLKHAQAINADLILNADPDADRIGIMVKHLDGWKFFNGNQIGILLTDYVISKQKQRPALVVKTEVTSSLISIIAKAQGVDVVDDLLVGFKYIGQLMNQLESENRQAEFLLGCEESHGFLGGNYVRDKDAAIAGLWLSELASELKDQGKTLVDHLNHLFSKYGYFSNFLTEIRLPGAEGMSQIQQIQTSLRSSRPSAFGEYQVSSVEDWQDRLPLVSETDKVAKNGLAFLIKPHHPEIASIKISMRPSGTEPKIKMYFEIGSHPYQSQDHARMVELVSRVKEELEQNFMLYCYKVIGIDFPERGFLLFWQLPLQSKLHYFKIEPEIADLIQLPANERQSKLDEILAFLGSDPLKKINQAFKARYHSTVEEYLKL